MNPTAQPHPEDRDAALARAMAAVAAAAPRAAADPDRPAWHLAPPAQWMNDPNGTIFHGGWYHVFYQLHPYGDRWGAIHWGHARSRDLVRWEHEPIALVPDRARDEEHCFSGCAFIADDGLPRILYTSIGFGGDAGRPSEQRYAVGDATLARWRQVDRPAIGRGRAGEPAFDRMMRDPYVFTLDGRRCCVLGASLDGESVIALYEDASIDGSAWRYRGLLHREAPGTLPYPECPNLFPLGDRWLLAVSPYGPLQWRLGTIADGRMTVERRGLLDASDQWYASNTLTDADGRTVLLGWIRGFPDDRGWNGCLASPRLIEPDERAGVRQRPHPALAALRVGEPIAWRGAARDLDLGEPGDLVEVRARLALAGGGELALELCGGAITLRWDGRALRVPGLADALPLAADELDLHVLVDRGVVEVFADGGRVVVTRVVHGARGAGARVVATGGGVRGEVVVNRLARPRDDAQRPVLGVGTPE